MNRDTYQCVTNSTE